MITLGTSIAATTSAIQPGVPKGGESKALIVEGTWGGTTAALQISADGTNWVGMRPRANGAAISMTSNGHYTVWIPPGCYLRITITGGAGVSLNAHLL